MTILLQQNTGSNYRFDGNEDFLEWLDRLIQAKYNSKPQKREKGGEHEVDGIVFYYSGHGSYKNTIVTHGTEVILSLARVYESLREIIGLQDKPILMIIDACRGSQRENSKSK